MENDEETLRLDLKTDVKVVEQQALWAGIKPGLRPCRRGSYPGHHHAGKATSLAGPATAWGDQAMPCRSVARQPAGAYRET